MTKKIWGILALTTIIGLIAIFTFTKKNDQGIYVYVESGTVLTKNTKDDTYVPVSNNKALIKNNSYVKTQSGLAHIIFPDNSVTSLAEQSEIKVAYSKNKISILQLLGTTYERVEKLASGKSFEVQTAGTLAAVRGTKFAVSYNANIKKAKIAVTENIVAVSRVNASTTQPTEVSVGALATVDENLPINGKQSVTVGLTKNDVELKNWLDRNTLIDQYIGKNPNLFFDIFVKERGDTNTLNGLHNRLEKTKTPTKTTEAKNDNTTKKGSLKNLLALGGSQKCSYTYAGDGVTSSATIYLSTGKMRVDSETIMNTKTIHSHMILMDNTNYIWGDGMPQGIRMTVPDSQASVSSMPQGAQTFDINKEINYSCSSWGTDTSYFKIPTDIQFTDLTEMMNQFNPVVKTSATVNNQCSVCESMPEPSKTECKRALSCG